MLKRDASWENGCKAIDNTSDGLFSSGSGGVDSIHESLDNHVQFVRFSSGQILALVKSATGYPAYYPLPDQHFDPPVEAVLMDLDGTTVMSEDLWIHILELVMNDLLGTRGFSFSEYDISFVSGHSVSEHLMFCIDTYAPGVSLQTAKERYTFHTHTELQAIAHGEGFPCAFEPATGVKEFLLELKETGVQIALVTSGLHEKAWPEIVDAFKTMNLGKPEEFYDTIITAGSPLGHGKAGTLGEMQAKPHPWLYAEAACTGLGIPYGRRNKIIGIEDSGAGVISIALAGFTPIGKAGGNIKASGALGLCGSYVDTFDEISYLAGLRQEHPMK